MNVDALPVSVPEAVSINRLACLQRHWMWADDARARFEQALASGWEYDADPMADRLFAAYHHWCGLLCGCTEAALEHGFLSAEQRDALGADLTACLPVLRASRQLLVVIPESREDHPRLVDLLRDDGILRCLRRIHGAFGHVLREGQMFRELDLLDTQER